MHFLTEYGFLAFEFKIYYFCGCFDFFDVLLQQMYNGQKVFVGVFRV